LSLAALVVAAGVVVLTFRDEPDQAIVTVAVMAFVASAVGVVLNWRIAHARSHALRDPLTGLPNRALLDDRIEQAIVRSRRTNEPFAVIVVDLDNFKDVNDVHGHAAGDAVLRALAQRFSAAVRESDTVARIGGDEFVVLSPTTGDDDEAAALVGRLRHALRKPFDVEGSAIELDGSIGWAISPDDGSSSDELLARADGRMYATKRDTVDESLLVRRGVDAGVVRDFEAAVADDELVVFYQPILDLRTGAPHSAEALVRRLLPDRALLPPAEFVPHVERTPLVRELTFIVIADALRSAKLWREAGHRLGVSVNVPYRLLDDPQFADGLVGLLRSSDAEPWELTLEVVPSGPGAGSELDGAVLRRLSDIGVRFSLDDCGRAASFAALRVLPLHQLKIDAGFVHGLGRNDTDAALVRGMIEMGHSLGLSVVAEGVETRRAWHVLADWGCDYAQGFYVATPRPAEELVDWLASSWPAVA
jgi:diguanylate cyclase (GGDEF)-like protein